VEERKKDMNKDISVIIPTFNNANSIDRTLKGLVETNKGELSIEIIIVDNNSNDSTKSIVQAYSGLLNINYLFEKKPGKNCALNCAIQNVELGNIVIFTDDDVDPDKNWFLSIYDICKRYPKHSVFGGRINVVYPFEHTPDWVLDDHILSFAFTYHNYSEVECIYKGQDHPFGPNFWVRKEVFKNGRMFNEMIGPSPNKGSLGDEAEFLINLIQEGYEIVYSPETIVGHRVKAEVLSLNGICRRAYRHGRGFIYLWGVPMPSLFGRFYIAWIIFLTLKTLVGFVKLFFEFIFSNRRKRMGNIARRISTIAYYVESMRLANDQKRLINSKCKAIRQDCN
jgi:glycosyltransferase involved in cell wall biosynthesis